MTGHVHDPDPQTCLECCGLAAGREFNRPEHPTDRVYMSAYRRGIQDHQTALGLAAGQVMSASGKVWPCERFPGTPFPIGQRVWHGGGWGGGVFLGRSDLNPDLAFVMFDDDGDQASQVYHEELTEETTDES